jgi:hypothetical protein
VYIKDLLKLPLVYNIAVIIPFSYPACDVIAFLLVDACLARDLFRELEADLGRVEGLVDADVVWEVNNNSSSIGS